MKIIIISLLITTSLSLFSNEIGNDIIRDPSVSRRCKSLIKSRNLKVELVQKINSLMRRNEALTKRLKEKEKTALQRLLINKDNLKQKLSLTRVQISQMEENIVRSGCPGITL